MKRSTRFGEVSVFTISTKIRSTFTYTSVNVPIAPPIQIENGAVNRMTAPSATTPASSGVKTRHRQAAPEPPHHHRDERPDGGDLGQRQHSERGQLILRAEGRGRP